MDNQNVLLSFLGGLLLVFFVWLTQRLTAQLKAREEECSRLQVRAVQAETRMVEERKAAEEKLALLNDSHKKMADTFKLLSADALKNNTQSFLELATTKLERFQEGARGDLTLRQKAIDELVKPIKESLTKVDMRIHEMEKERISAFSGLTEQVKSMAHTQNRLHLETANLVKALR